MRVFTSQRGSVASELTFGMMVVGVLVLGGLVMMAQLEGISFAVLLHQLRHSRETRSAADAAGPE